MVFSTEARCAITAFLSFCNIKPYFIYYKRDRKNRIVEQRLMPCSLVLTNADAGNSFRIKISLLTLNEFACCDFPIIRFKIKINALLSSRFPRPCLHRCQRHLPNLLDRRQLSRELQLQHLGASVPMQGRLHRLLQHLRSRTHQLHANLYAQWHQHQLLLHHSRREEQARSDIDEHLRGSRPTAHHALLLGRNWVLDLLQRRQHLHPASLPIV